MRIGFLGDPFDPASQLFAAHLREQGAMVFPLHDVQTGHTVDGFACGSAEAFLARTGGIIAAKRPVTVLLRRRSEREEDLDWRTRFQLLKTILDDVPDLQVTLVTLRGVGADMLGDLVDRPVQVLPPRHVAGERSGLLHFDSEKETLQYGEDTSRTFDANAVSWLRLCNQSRIAAIKPTGDHVADLVAYADASVSPTVTPHPKTSLPTFLFIVVNGVGLGHLTRLLAIAQVLRETSRARVIFWCYSRAAGILEAYGFEVIQRMTWEHLNLDKPQWEAWETADFASLFRDHHLAGVVYDGAAVPKALTDAIRIAGTPPISLAWMRRAMWQPNTNPDYLEAAQHCDLVIEPGDIAAEADQGPTTFEQLSHRGSAEFIRVPTICLTKQPQMLTKRQARRTLGLPPRKRICLVSLGGDAFGRTATIMQLIEETARVAKIELVVAHSPLASTADRLSGGYRSVSVFPLARYLAAFDGIISAAGYNSYHEMLALSDVPLLFAPTVHSRLDDQNARAHYAQKKGWSISLPDKGAAEQRQVLSDFWRDVAVGTKRASPRFDENSARIVADLLAERML